MSDIVEEIKKLKKEKNAVILAHNYQSSEIQDIADYLGDSLELSKLAVRLPYKVIVFCGVKFMAETCKILSPDKIVILPDKDAGCPLADMVNPEDIEREKKRHPNSPVLSYVNTSAEVKAKSDYCCTSANSAKVSRHISSDEILFFPDRNLGEWTQEKVENKKFHLWNGYCYVHMKIRKEDIEREKRKHPDARVIVHPECKKEVREVSDEILSTGGMVKIAKDKKYEEFIIGTEIGIIHRLKKENPEKSFYPASPSAICYDMKKITLSKVLHSLQTLSPQITLSRQIIQEAYKSIERMVEIT